MGTMKKQTTQSKFDKEHKAIEKIRMDFYYKKIDFNEMVERFKKLGHSQMGAQRAANYICQSNPIAWLMREKDELDVEKYKKFIKQNKSHNKKSKEL